MKIKTLFNKIKRYYYKALGHLPSPLPVGLTEFESWSNSIIDIYDLEGLADKDSLKYVLATTIMSLDPAVSSRPKYYMARRLRKAAANQIASFVFQDIKTKQQEAAKAAAQTASENAPK